MIITGSGFVSGAAVKVAGVPASVVNVDSPTQITCVVPAINNKFAGLVDIEVINPDGQRAVLKNSFNYRATVAPGGIASAQALGNAGVGKIVACTGIPSAYAGGSSSLIRRISPSGIATGYVSGSQGINRKIIDNAGAIGSSYASGTLKTTLYVAAPPSIATAEAFGSLVAFNPKAMTNIKAWFDGKRANAHLDGSNHVTTWDNAAGTGVGNITNGAGFQPDYLATGGPGGTRPAVGFPTFTSLGTTSIAGASSFTVYIVALLNAVGTDIEEYFWLNSEASAGAAFKVNSSGTRQYIFRGGTTSSSGAISGSWAVYCFTLTGTTATLYINGTLSNTFSSVTYNAPAGGTASGFQIRNGGSGTENWRCAELIWTNQQDSSTVRDNCTTYLRTKWGI